MKKKNKNNYTFGLFHGPLDLSNTKTLEFYKNELCINDECILKRDIPKYNMLHNIYHYNDEKDKKIYYLDNIKFTKDYLLSYFPLLTKSKIDDKG